MRMVGLGVVLLLSCSRGHPAASPDRAVNEAMTPASRGSNANRADVGDAANPELLRVDTPKATIAGNTFIAPAGWTFATRGRASILTAPEGDSFVAFVDVQAESAEAAAAAAWTACGRDEIPPVIVVDRDADRDGWTDDHGFEYEVPPSASRLLYADVRRANDVWLVTLVDLSNAILEKRIAQIQLMFDRRFPKGYVPESFAGKSAHRLDDARIAELGKFVESARTQLGVPGVALGIVQDRKVVFLGGFGVREIGKTGKVDGDTKFMIASNTKALTTLMLAKLVDEKRIAWDSPATTLLPSFAIGDAATTAKVQVQHLVCACTGLPRQDAEFAYEFATLTPRKVIESLATMQPTSAFGELYQYSNPLAAAAGFIGGHVAFPRLELGRAYDEAMRSLVFAPLGMRATTLDHGRAQRGNWARPHAPDDHDKTKPTFNDMNAAVVPVRPAGGAWSTARDMLAYVQMELAEGLLPDGERYISKDALLARRAPQVAYGKDATYGMGLTVETKYDVTVVHHGGAAWGYYSDMMWLPEHGVGAVVLTNGDPGWTIRDVFRRKLLEVLFDGKAEADAAIAAAAKRWYERRAAARKLLAIPADPDLVAELAPVYRNAVLGDLAVRRVKGTTIFDFGEWESEVASRRDRGGAASFVLLVRGDDGDVFVVGRAEGKRTLVLRDHQHEYVFIER